MIGSFYHLKQNNFVKDKYSVKFPQFYHDTSRKIDFQYIVMKISIEEIYKKQTKPSCVVFLVRKLRATQLRMTTFYLNHPSIELIEELN